MRQLAVILPAGLVVLPFRSVILNAYPVILSEAKDLNLSRLLEVIGRERSLTLRFFAFGSE